MNLYHLLIFTCLMLLACNSHNKDSRNSSCNNDSVLVLQEALNSPVMDSLFLPYYRDSVLKIKKAAPGDTTCRLRWKDKELIYLNPDEKTIADPGDFEKRIINGKSQMAGTRLPSFVAEYQIKLVHSNLTKASLIFRNNGISIDFELLKQNNNWTVDKYNCQRF